LNKDGKGNLIIDPSQRSSSRKIIEGLKYFLIKLSNRFKNFKFL
jgi:hypothetical protein